MRIRKVSTRSGRPEMLDDGHVVEGDEVGAPTPGMPYSVRRTVIEHEGAPEIFATSPVRALIVRRQPHEVYLMTDNSRYLLEFTDD